jgi:general secretion pathway protein G
MSDKRECGFTLVEILVVATIIALLSTIGISGFQAITRNGRDALRKADLEQVRSALEIYKSTDSSHNYPDASGCDPSGLVTDYLNKLPADPKYPTYKYCYTKDSALTYHLCAHLENGDTTEELCTAGNCGSGEACGEHCNCNYRVNNP